MSAFNRPSANLAGITVADLRRLGQAQGQRELLGSGLGLALGLSRGPNVDNPQTDSLATARIIDRNRDFMNRRLAEEERKRQADQADYEARQDAEAKRQTGLQQASQTFQASRDEAALLNRRDDAEAAFRRQKQLIPLHAQVAEAARVAAEQRRQQSPEYVAEQQAKREAEAARRQKQFDDHIAKIAGAIPTSTIMAPDASADDISTYDPNTGQEGFGVDEDLSAAIQTRMNEEGPAWEAVQRSAEEQRRKAGAAEDPAALKAARARAAMLPPSELEKPGETPADEAAREELRTKAREKDAAAKAKQEEADRKRENDRARDLDEATRRASNFLDGAAVFGPARAAALEARIQYELKQIKIEREAGRPAQPTAPGRLRADPLPPSGPTPGAPTTTAAPTTAPTAEVPTTAPSAATAPLGNVTPDGMARVSRLAEVYKAASPDEQQKILSQLNKKFMTKAISPEEYFAAVHAMGAY